MTNVEKTERLNDIMNLGISGTMVIGISGTMVIY